MRPIVARWWAKFSQKSFLLTSQKKRYGTACKELKAHLMTQIVLAT